MQHRANVFVAKAAILAALALTSCGGAGFEANIGDDGERPRLETPGYYGALYSSSKGPSLYMIGQDGRAVDAVRGAYAVKEQMLDSNSMEWTITDTQGGARSILLRIASRNPIWQPVEVYRGETWGGEAPAIVTGMPNGEPGGIDMAVVPLAKQLQPTVANTAGQVVLRVIFSNDPQRQASLRPEERTGVGDGTYRNFYPWYKTMPIEFYDLSDPANAEKAQEYSDYPGTYPYAENTSTPGDTVAHWNGQDNHVQAASGYPPDPLFPDAKLSDRDVLGQAWQNPDAKEYILEPIYNDSTTYPLTETFISGGVPVTGVIVGYRLHFRATLAGDYDRNGEVNIADVAAVGSHFYDQSENNAIAGAKHATNNNPFRGDDDSFDPANWIDGSLDGWVYVPGTEGDVTKITSSLMYPSAAGVEQYLNDLSPIASHFHQRVTDYNIDWIGTDPADTKKFTTPYQPGTGNNPQTISVDFTMTDRGANSEDIFPGAYEVRVTPRDSTNAIDPDTSAILDNVNVLAIPYLPIGVDTTRPVWDNVKQQGVTAATPGKTMRSINVAWGGANDPDSGISKYIIWLTIYEPTNPADYTNPNWVCNPMYLGFQVKIPVSADLRRKEITAADVPGFGGLWKPNAAVGVVVTAVNKSQNTTIEDSNFVISTSTFNPTLNVKWTRVSWDSEPPEWQNTENNPLGITEVSYGVNPAGEPGFMVYYDFAYDLDTGISEYRAYYKPSSSPYAADGKFLDAEIDLMDLETPLPYLSTKTYDLFGGPFEKIQLSKRFFFIPGAISAPIHVLIKAYNGEGPVDTDNRTTNAATLNLQELEDFSLFKRLTLSERLNPDFDSGDMARETGFMPNHLFVVNATDEEVVSRAEEWDANLDGWTYAADGSPLDRASWDGSRVPNGNEAVGDYDEDNKTAWTLTQPGGSGRPWETVYGIANNSQISAAWNTSNQPRIGFLAFDDPAGTNQLGFAYGPLVAGPGLVLGRRWEYYDMGDTEYLGLPCDVTRDSIGLTHHWWDHDDNGDGDLDEDDDIIHHVPTFMESVDLHTYSNHNQHEYQLSPDHTRGQLAMIETTQLENYWFNESPESFALTLYSRHFYTNDDPGQGSNTELILYWHNHLEDLVNASLEIDNIMLPMGLTYPPYERERRDEDLFSWRPPLFRPSKELISTAIGLPATLSSRMESSTTTGYILYNDATVLGAEGLCLARTTGPGATVFRSMVNNFPALHPGYVDTFDSMPERKLCQSIDSEFGASILEFRGGRLSGFDSTGSWTGLEGNATASGILAEQPLCFTYIHSGAQDGDTGLPGYRVYYGEIYNAHTPASAVCVLELVDCIEIITNETEQRLTKFQPIWCALGMAEGDFGWGTDRQVPVVAYGTHVDGYVDENSVSRRGLLRIASPPKFLPTPLTFARDWTYITGTNPPAGETYTAINGTTPTETALGSL